MVEHFKFHHKVHELSLNVGCQWNYKDLLLLLILLEAYDGDLFLHIEI